MLLVLRGISSLVISFHKPEVTPQLLKVVQVDQDEPSRLRPDKLSLFSGICAAPWMFGDFGHSPLILSVKCTMSVVARSFATDAVMSSGFRSQLHLMILVCGDRH